VKPVHYVIRYNLHNKYSKMATPDTHKLKAYTARDALTQFRVWARNYGYDTRYDGKRNAYVTIESVEPYEILSAYVGGRKDAT